MLAVLLASLAGLAAGALEWRRLARAHAGLALDTVLAKARYLYALIPLTALLLAGQVAVVLAPETVWDAPVWLELHHVALLLGSIAFLLAFLFGLATTGAFLTRQRQRGAAAIAGALVLGVVGFVARDVSAPIADLRDRVSDGVVLQSTGASCAAASAANLVRELGGQATEREMAARLGTTRYGTTPAQVVAGLSEIGLACRKLRLTARDLGELDEPAILFFPPTGEGAGHAVLFTRASDGDARIVDPLSGRRRASSDELARQWSGHAVVCDRGVPGG